MSNRAVTGDRAFNQGSKRQKPASQSSGSQDRLYALRLGSGLCVALLLVFIVVSFGCENMNGERTVSGKLPLESNTEEAERINNSLTLPEGSVLLETRILSKAESAVVTKKYSTQYDCKEVDSYFRKYLTANNWSFLYFTPGRFPQDTYSTFSRDDFEIGVWCQQMRDYRGIRKFYISSSW
jgi:hypothetical protein